MSVYEDDEVQVPEGVREYIEGDYSTIHKKYIGFFKNFIFLAPPLENPLIVIEREKRQQDSLAKVSADSTTNVQSAAYAKAYADSMALVQEKREWHKKR